MMHVKIYSDGACSGNPGPGGWGACIIIGDKITEIYGHDLDTTNNRMELIAAIKALEGLQESSVIDLYTDSKYVQMGISQWIAKWLINNWRTSNKEPVKNVDLWQRLLDLTNFHQVTWHWVKGHSSNKYNNIADALAVKGRDAALGLL
jgi:ribonuclease HI